MKTALALIVLLASVSSFAGGKPHYYCVEDNGTDLSVTIDLAAKTATMTGQNARTVYVMTAAFDTLPARFVYGVTQECAIQFVPLGDGRTGTASFRCNEKKYPRLPKLDMECTYLKK